MKFKQKEPESENQIVFRHSECVEFKTLPDVHHDEFKELMLLLLYEYIANLYAKTPSVKTRIIIPYISEKKQYFDFLDQKFLIEDKPHEFLLHIEITDIHKAKTHKEKADEASVTIFCGFSRSGILYTQHTLLSCITEKVVIFERSHEIKYISETYI